MKPCPVKIPEITRDMTPTVKTGIKNAKKLLAYLENGLEDGNLPLRKDGLLNRSEVAEKNGFGRSAYAQNDVICAIADWADKQLGAKPRQSGGAGTSTKNEREMASEIERLKRRNATLKVELRDSEQKLQELGYTEEQQKDGDPRIPWGNQLPLFDTDSEKVG